MPNSPLFSVMHHVCFQYFRIVRAVHMCRPCSALVFFVQGRTCANKNIMEEMHTGNYTLVLVVQNTRWEKEKELLLSNAEHSFIFVRSLSKDMRKFEKEVNMKGSLLFVMHFLFLVGSLQLTFSSGTIRCGSNYTQC